MEGALRRSLGSQAQHTHSLEDHTWSIQQSTTTHTKHIHNIQQQNSNYTHTHCELFHQTIHKHATHKTNRDIHRGTHNIQGYNITLTTSQVQEAIKQIKNNNSQGPDKLNIRHLKHIGPLGSSQTTSRDAKPTQHIEITHPNNVNLKLAFHKVASFHPHYSTFTPQTYHHPVHRFRSWPMQMTSQSHPHTQV